jgi:histidine ammonia-lyase
VSDLVLSGDGLSLADAVRAAASPSVRLRTHRAAMRRVLASRAVIDEALAEGRPVYGVNTGFGKLQGRTIAPADLVRLQRNLVLSHACGVGEPFSAAETRLMMLLRIQSLLRGHSGVTPRLVERLVAIWNAGVVPVVPQQGSVGASGDLAPLAHVALTVIGEGEAFHGGRRMASRKALQRAGLAPAYELREKEGLGLLNGTQAMTAVALLAVGRAESLLRHADLATAMTLDALRYSVKPFDARVQAVRPHPGQAATARNVRGILRGSAILASHAKPHGKVQDPYSVRCAPQVHGACRDALTHVRDVVVREANATTDNPLVFADDGAVVSGGNFHGEPVAMACDYLAIAAAELGSISERRIENLVNPDISGLPPFLARDAGVGSGLMIAQVAAAALVSENKSLAHPASVDSIPTSANQEDHVSMGTIAARKARDVVANAERVLAIEFLCAAEAMEHRRPLRSARPVEAAHAEIRSRVKPLVADRLLATDIAAVAELMASGALLSAAEKAGGRVVGVSD